MDFEDNYNCRVLNFISNAQHGNSRSKNIQQSTDNNIQQALHREASAMAENNGGYIYGRKRKW